MATPAQSRVRRAFKKCTQCFALQPESGGAEPPDEGPRNRSWWYANSTEPWYYNSFIKDSMAQYLQGTTPVWCQYIVDDGNSGASIEKGSDGEYLIDDGYDLPVGYTDDMLQMYHSNSRAAISFYIGDLSVSTINNFSTAKVFISLGYGRGGPFSVYFHKWTSGGYKPPGQYSEIPFTGAQIASFNYNGIGGGGVIDCKSYLLECKALNLTSMYFAIKASSEAGAGSPNWCKVRGPSNATSPASLVLGV